MTRKTAIIVNISGHAHIELMGQRSVAVKKAR